MGSGSSPSTSYLFDILRVEILELLFHKVALFLVEAGSVCCSNLRALIDCFPYRRLIMWNRWGRRHLSHRVDRGFELRRRSITLVRRGWRRCEGIWWVEAWVGTHAAQAGAEDAAAATVRPSARFTRLYRRYQLILELEHFLGLHWFQLIPIMSHDPLRLVIMQGVIVRGTIWDSGLVQCRDIGLRVLGRVEVALMDGIQFFQV